MIEQQGRVASLEGKRAWVEIGGQSGCPACDAGQGCGAGLFGKLLNRSSARVLVENKLEVSAGQGVVLGIDEALYLRLVMKLYGYPLLAGLAGGAVAFAVASYLAISSPAVVDLLTALGALLVAALTLQATRRRLPHGFTHLSPVLLDTGEKVDCNDPDRHE